MTRKPVRSKIGEGRTIAVVGDVYHLLATGKETDGKYALIEAIVPPGGGPPPHKHSREEEGFFVLEGELRITVDGEPFVARPGDFVNLPVGSLHSFTNATDKPAKMLITLVPAGLEQLFVEIGHPASPDATSASPPTPEELAQLPAVAARYGVTIVVPKH
jgi:quercetin dioxygenase-like cupin family protein